jgi:hypothetical protein
VAAWGGHDAVVQMLLEAGAAMETRNEVRGGSGGILRAWEGASGGLFRGVLTGARDVHLCGARFTNQHCLHREGGLGFRRRGEDVDVGGNVWGGAMLR